MSKTVKRQVAFYADPDIEQFLGQLDPGVKTRTINTALRAWKETRPATTGPGIYDDSLASLAAWLNGLQPPITVSNTEGQTIALGGLLDRFISQEGQRQPEKSWSQIAAEGGTLMAPTAQCVSCQISLLPGQSIQTPSRGTLCRNCFELPKRVVQPDTLSQVQDWIMSFFSQFRLEPGSYVWPATADPPTLELQSRNVHLVFPLALLEECRSADSPARSRLKEKLIDVARLIEIREYTNQKITFDQGFSFFITPMK
jgi:hypothetical protein